MRSSSGLDHRTGTLAHSDAQPPLARNFGQFLSKQPGFLKKYPNLARAAHHAGRELSKIGLDDLWTCLDYYAKLSGVDGALPDRDWLWPAVKELKGQALLWLYGRRCDAAADSLPASDEYTLGDILKNRIEVGDVIVSFNYDTIVERLAKRFNQPVRHCGGAPCGVVKFVKPHGSASWRLRHLLRTVIDGDPVLDSLAEDMNNDPLLLGAVPIKSELLREIQAYYKSSEVFSVIMHQWRGVVEAVRDADELVVVGYSFPKEDQYGSYLFREACRQRGTKPIRRIEYYNKDDQEESLRKVFRHVRKIVPRGPVRAPK